MSKKTNGSGGNGHDKSGEVVHFPGAKERKKLKAEEEKHLRELYKAERKSKKEPFLNTGNIPPFVKIFISALLLINIPFLLFTNSGTKLSIIYQFGFIPGMWTGSFEWNWTALVSPLTHIALHGDWMHFFFNAAMGTALALFFEKTYGSRMAVKFFFACCLGGLTLFTALDPFGTSPLVGASAGISGLFGGILYNILGQIQQGPKYISTAAVTNGQHAMRQRVAKFMKKKGPWPILIFWGVFMTLIGLLSGDNVAWSAHLGGYATGIVLLVLMEKGKIKL